MSRSILTRSCAHCPLCATWFYIQLLLAAADKQGNVSLWHIDHGNEVAPASESALKPKNEEEEAEDYDGTLGVEA